MCVVHLFIRNTPADVLHVGVDVLHVGKAQQDFGKVLLADGGHPLRVGEKLNFQHLSLEVIHESEKQESGEADVGGNKGCGKHRVVYYNVPVPVEIIKRELRFPFLPKEMHQ